MKQKERTVANIRQIEQLLKLLKSNPQLNKRHLERIAPNFSKSAVNLIHYQSLRSQDIRPLQKDLREYGLSRLAKSQSHVLASLSQSHLLLNLLVGKTVPKRKSGLSIRNGRRLLKKNTGLLFGRQSNKRRVRLMVTMPTGAADDYALVRDMLAQGMNCARINCAHDDATVWLRIIENVKRAAQELQREVKIAMDLAGPKLRSGMLEDGPRVVKISPVRDDYGKVVAAANIRISANSAAETNVVLPVEVEWIKRRTIGETLQLIDTRGKSVNLYVQELAAGELTVAAKQTLYIKTGTKIVGANNDETEVGLLPALERSILLQPGDELIVEHSDGPGFLGRRDRSGKYVELPRIGCGLAQVFEHVKLGERILFDDGKIEGRIVWTEAAKFGLEIVRTKDGGSKLRAEKGMNFPDSKLDIRGLTDKDRQDLEFVVKHADIINFSFVNTPQDVEELYACLDALDARADIGVILKIETKASYQNLFKLLLKGMQRPILGVMIARGDLAVEIGWNNLGAVQEEILSICKAAHVPVIWATQVLENLAKKGLPSRAEITDVITAIKAECVMLNKGPHIGEAMALLNEILTGLEKHKEKDESQLAQLLSLS